MFKVPPPSNGIKALFSWAFGLVFLATGTTGEPLNETSSARATLDTVRGIFDVSNLGVISGVFPIFGGPRELAGVHKVFIERGGKRFRVETSSQLPISEGVLVRFLDQREDVLLRTNPKWLRSHRRIKLKRDKVDLFLKDFNYQCDLSLKEMWREKDAAVSCINTMYKLELMKLPQEVQEMKWDDYYNQAGEDPLALSKAISTCLEDSICGKADAQVSQVKSAMQPPQKRTRNESQSSTTRASRIWSHNS